MFLGMGILADLPFDVLGLLMCVGFTVGALFPLSSTVGAILVPLIMMRTDEVPVAISEYGLLLVALLPLTTEVCTYYEHLRRSKVAVGRLKPQNMISIVTAIVGSAVCIVGLPVIQPKLVYLAAAVALVSVSFGGNVMLTLLVHRSIMASRGATATG